MKKFLPYILILVIIVNLFAPFSVVFNQQKGLKIEKREVVADDTSISSSENGISLNFTLIEIKNGITPVFDINIEWPEVGTSGNNEKLTEEVYLTYRKMPGIDVTDSTVSSLKRSGKIDQGRVSQSGLEEDSKYGFALVAKQYKDGGFLASRSIHTNIITFSTTKVGDPNKPINISADPKGNLFQNTDEGTSSDLPECGLIIGQGTFAGCFIQLFYYAIFIPTSFIFGLAGQFFDWAFAYSIADSSYRSTFVTEGWGIVRDISNLFFIFVLIYAAFGMILSIQSIKAKEIIVNTILIGLLINFSLFAGQVLIDLSNILTRVFYNSDVITVSLATDTSATTASGININQNSDLGEIAMSAALVNKINPQKIILQMSKVQPKDSANRSNEEGISTGTWFLVILLASAVNIVGLYVFFSVALLFIARVIGLWFALIFAPLAFFSYTVPQMQNIERIGWKKWWPELLGLCFMAPIFMFLMYLILMFLNTAFTGLDGQIAGTHFLLSVIVPFVFIIMLLLMAKKIAVKYSGQMGEMITKAGAMAGGAALGVGLGAVAVAGRGTIGRIGSAVASSDRLKRAEAAGGLGGFFAKNLLKGGKTLGTGSMDVRGIKVGGKTLANTGLVGLESISKKNEGGFIKRREDKVKARQERMRELEVGEDSRITQNIYLAQNELDRAKSNVDTQNEIRDQTKNIADAEKEVATADKEVVKAERDLKDAIDKFGASSKEADTARTERTKKIDAKDKIIKDKLDVAKDKLKAAEEPIKKAEQNVKNMENVKIAANRKRREDYADTIQGGWSNGVNMVLSGGQHAVRGEREAANKILAGIRDEKK